MKLKLSILGILFPFVLLAQNKLKYDQIRPIVQNLSYFDSTELFKKGAEAIIIARAEGNPEKEAEITIYYGNHFYYKSEKAKSKIYFQKALKIAEKYKSEKYVLLSKIRLSYLKWDEGEEANARSEFKRILKIALEKKIYIIQIECYNALALMEERHARIKNTLAYYLKGLKVAEEQNEEYYIAVFLNNIGLVKLNDNQYDEALNDFNRGVKISEKLNNARLTSHIYNNIALIYMEKGKKEEALQQYKNILVYAHKSGNPREMGIAAINLSNLYRQDSNYQMATKYADTALLVFQKSKLYLELTKAYLSKAQLMTQMQNLPIAIQLITKAQHLADSTKNLEDAVGIHVIKSRIYQQQGKFEDALTEYKEFKKLNDSLRNEYNTKFITEIQSKYNFEKKESEVEKLKNQKLKAENKNLVLAQENIERTRMFTIVIVVIIVLLLLIVGFFYASYNRKVRNQQQYFTQQLITSIESERNRIAKDLHDDIGQSLSAIKSSVHFLKTEDEKEEKIAILENNIGSVIEQTRDISRKLYPSYLEKIGLVRSVARLMEGIQENTGLICSFDIDEKVNELPIDELTHIYRIIQECVNNTIKHAEATALKVSIAIDKDGYELIYQDNGKGLDKSNSKSLGIGFMSLKERARILIGELNISDHTSKGFKLILNFKGRITDGKV